MKFPPSYYFRHPNKPSSKAASSSLHQKTSWWSAFTPPFNKYNKIWGAKKKEIEYIYLNIIFFAKTISLYNLQVSDEYTIVSFLRCCLLKVSFCFLSLFCFLSRPLHFFLKFSLMIILGHFCLISKSLVVLIFSLVYDINYLSWFNNISLKWI